MQENQRRGGGRQQTHWVTALRAIQIGTGLMAAFLFGLGLGTMNAADAVVGRAMGYNTTLSHPFNLTRAQELCRTYADSIFAQDFMDFSVAGKRRERNVRFCDSVLDLTAPDANLTAGVEINWWRRNV